MAKHKYMKCCDCTFLDKCSSGQRCVNLNKDFARYCPVGKTKMDGGVEHG